MNVWMPNAAGEVAHFVPADRTIENGCAPTLCSPHRPLNLRPERIEGLRHCVTCEQAANRECGTYAGYQAHTKRGLEPCGPCREANAQYIRDRRADRPDVREADRRYNTARSRAMHRLAQEQPARFRELLDEELAA